MKLKANQPQREKVLTLGGVVQTNKTQLRELQDHPLLQRLLQSKVLHGGEVVGTSDYVVLQLLKTIKELI